MSSNRDRADQSFNDVAALLQEVVELQGRINHLKAPERSLQLLQEDLEASLAQLCANFDFSEDGLLIIDHFGKVKNYNQKFVRMWNIPEKIIHTGNDAVLLDYVMDQVKNPRGFHARVAQLYQKPQAESYDIIEFKDGRVFERYSRPQIKDGENIGRTWRFRNITQDDRRKSDIHNIVTFPSGNPNPVIRVSESGIVIYSNDTGRLILEGWQCRVGKAVPRQWQDLIADALKTNNACQADMRLDGQVFALTVIPLQASGYANIYGVNVTERIELESGLSNLENQLHNLIETMHDGLIVRDENGILSFVNRRFSEIIGYAADEILGRPQDDFLDKPNRKILEKQTESRKMGRREPYELTWMAKGGRSVHTTISPKPIFDTLGKFRGCISEVTDITGIKWAESQLQASEARYRMLVETMNDGLMMLDEDAVITYGNSRINEMLGYRPDEFVGRPIFEFLDQPNIAIVNEQLIQRRKGEHDPYELTWLRNDGRATYTIVSPMPIFDAEGRFRGSHAVVTDITHRKRAEEEIRESERKLRLLSEHLLSVQEQERKRISLELHDELGQSLSLLKIQLGAIGRKLLPEQPELTRELEQTRRYLSQVIEDVRRISRHISPAILEDFGLPATIKWLVSEFTQRYQIKCDLDMDDISGVFRSEMQTVLYRIFQEIFVNVLKHADAKHMSVSIKKRDTSVAFQVEDDGIGFDLSTVVRQGPMEKGMGLATMQERLRMMNAELEIQTGRGKGTRIGFEIQLDGRIDGGKHYMAGYGLI